MTLLDAPAFNEARARRRRTIAIISGSSLLVLIVAFWLAAGRPVAWPWYWYTHLRGRAAVNKFLNDVERNDLVSAYGVWMHDPYWQKHPDRDRAYSFARFQQDWSPESPENEYGVIKSHKIVAARMSGNVVLIGVRMNGLKSKAMFLDYDPKAHTLGFSPVELYLGP